MKRRSPEEWYQLIQQWLLSGKSGAMWCRENQISYQAFGYWRKKNSSMPDSEPFVELTDVPKTDSQSGVDLFLGGVTLQLTKDFDETTLLRCLVALKKLSC
jgi:hypothetical protein